MFYKREQSWNTPDSILNENLFHIPYHPYIILFIHSGGKKMMDETVPHVSLNIALLHYLPVGYRVLSAERSFHDPVFHFHHRRERWLNVCTVGCFSPSSLKSSPYSLCSAPFCEFCSLVENILCIHDTLQ